MKIPICRCKGWTTVRPWRHHARGKFQPFGYFPGRELARNRHCCYFWWRQPCTCIPRPSLSRYISPQIEWTVVGIDERWRDGVSPSLRSSRDDRIRHGFQSQENQPVLILLARLPADGVHPPTVPGDTRCDRLPARLRAGWFDLLPTECGHVNQFSDWPPGSAWHSSLGGNS